MQPAGIDGGETDTMSRIHEALKRAEQERAASSPAGFMPPVEAVVPAPPVRPAAVAPAHAQPETGPLTIDLIEARCAKPRWSLDHKTLLFCTGDSHAPGSEEFRTLRTRLYQMREKHNLRRILVTSALPAEGKTFTSANLAQVISRQHERRVLLIDADLRWSRMHISLGAPSLPGLTEYLRGEADELSIIQRGAQDNLFFIPGGKTVSNASELIGSQRMKQLLDRMTPLFDWIILDSPPAIPVADASHLADLCDGVLLVVRSATTPYDLAQKTRLDFSEKNLLGVVLNGTEPGSGYSSYYYDHYGVYGAKAKNGRG